MKYVVVIAVDSIVYTLVFDVVAVPSRKDAENSAKAWARSAFPTASFVNVLSVVRVVGTVEVEE